MHSVNVKQARQKFASPINAAEQGRSVAITRRGRQVAQLNPPAAKRSRRLPDLSDFRRQIRVRGRSVSATVIARRREERY
jgi:antitoxin (DNA-binding transcriptional repressor) of toxin-antitoxin stability system